jgi:N-acetyl-anhydromuramoyl-L-alanine amidase
MKIQKLPSSNFSSRNGEQVDMIVIHTASLPVGEFGTGYVLDLFLNRLDLSAHPSFKELEGLKVSSHYFIDRKGKVIELVEPGQAAWHAGVSSFEGRKGCNAFSIGIELEGTPDHRITERQFQGLKELCLLLMKRFPLITLKRIVGHNDIAPGRKVDPGPLFPWQRLREALREGVKGNA